MMQAASEKPPPIGLVLDGEMRGDPSNLISLAMAFGLSMLEKPECEILTLSLTGSSLEGAAYTGAVATFYTLASLRDFPPDFRRYHGLPIGLDASKDDQASIPALANTLARKDAAGEPLYPHEIHEFTDTADPAALIRNGLTSREDQSAVVVLNGPATNLARVLGLQGGRELIAAKVKLLVVALGDLPSPAPDAHVKADAAAARELFAKWPTPIIAAGVTLGEKLRFPAQKILSGFDWTQDHPIVDVCREQAKAQPPRDVSTREAAAVLRAIRPAAGYFGESQNGLISVGDDGSLRFEPSIDGRHTYLTFDESQAERLRETCFELVSAMPAARELPDYLKKQIEEEKQEELKKKQQKPAV